MKILHVISGLGVGGAESFLARLAPKLRQRGFEQTVVSLTGLGVLAGQIEAAGVSVIPLQIGLLRAPIEIVRLGNILRTFNPDIVQGWMYHGDLASALAYKLAGNPGRLFWGIRCSDMDLSGYSLQLRTVVRLCAAMSATPDMVIANSQAGADVHRKMGYTPQRMEIIRNGVDIESFRPDPEARRAVRTELGIPDSAKVLIHVARVDAMKDHAGLLAALESVPGLTGVLVGAGTEFLKLPPSVKALGRRDDVARLLTGADIIASSSAFGEGFPNALAEGMSCGLIPVTTGVGDSRLLAEGIGLVVPRSDPMAFADALHTVLSWPDDDRRKAGAAARTRIIDRFTLDKATDCFEALYRGQT